uniref:cathelicidin-2-like n=1 Tax=Euleptes europaea TaxID=460621 RepID=UPI00254147E5|nr:cathelicidin-2-like [Euleptes europaea]
MGSWVLLMLCLAVAARASPATQREFSYEEAISLAIDLYNQEPEVELAFRLLEAKPQPDWDPSMQSLQELEFTVQETTCPPAEQLNLDKCDFKDKGVVKECYGTIFSEQGAPVIRYLCETAGQGHIRVKRCIWRGIRKGIKKNKKEIKEIKNLPPCEKSRKEIKEPFPGSGSPIGKVPVGNEHIA